MFDTLLRRGRDLKIRTWLIIAFLSISLIPLFVVTYISYTNGKKALINEAVKSLTSIANRQSLEIETYIHEKELLVTTMTKDPTIIESIENFDTIFQKKGLQGAEYAQIEKELLPFFSHYKETGTFQNLYLVSAKGDIIYTFKKEKDFGTNLRTGPYKNTDLAKVFHLSTTLLQTETSDFQNYPVIDELAVFISAPVLKNGKVLGALIFQLNNNKLYNVVNDYTGLGKTGETIIVSKIGNSGVYMTPTRFDKQAANTHKFLLGGKEEPFLQKILNGNKVIGITTDYRDKEVFAVGYFFLPALQWGILVKVDTQELFAPINFLKIILLSSIFVTALLVIIASFLIAKSITDPIRLLIEKTNQIAKGDLSQRISISYKNEIGVLADSFNTMSERLDFLIKNLDRLVMERTREVDEKNDKLNESLKDIKSMQEQIVVKEKLASLGQLTAGIAHEIKNPLNFVNNFAQLSEKQVVKLNDLIKSLTTPLTEKEQISLNKITTTIDSNIKKIHQYGTRADSIIKNMLAHSREGASSNFQSTDINALLEENFKLVYHAKRAEDSTFNIQMEMKLDDTVGLIEILPQEFGRVILNILNNAFYAVQEKKKNLGDKYFPVVSITTKQEQDKVSVVFFDNGTGIPNDVVEKLFTPFYTTKPPGKGTGLGLSLSREIIVSVHHGELHIDTKEGEFTTFTIILPKKQPPRSESDEKNIGS